MTSVGASAPATINANRKTHHMSRKSRLILGAGSLVAGAGALVAARYGFPLADFLGVGAAGGVMQALVVPAAYPGRNSGEQQIHFFRKRFTVADVPALTAGLKIGRLPANTFLHSIMWNKTVAFNSATTDTLAIGSTNAGVDFLAATTLQGAGYVNHTAAAGLGLVAATIAGEADIWLKYAQTGAVATAGDVTLVLAFIPNNDQ